MLPVTPSGRVRPGTGWNVQRVSTHSIADRYSVTGVIGAGGGGTVWQATDEVLGRTVAVKEVDLPTHLSAADRDRVRGRAMREARSAARLEHRCVVSIYDVLEVDEALHIVMEHVDAPSLATLVTRDGPLPPHRVAAIGLDVLDGLAAAHRAGVVHRDVKPSNVLVPATGRAVVTDFGIAAVLGESGLTRTGQALGTPDYIAPEQLEDGPVGPPCDMWSLGATLYDAVEGVPPFKRERTMATIRAVASADPRPPERAGPLASVLQRLLTKDPAERPGVEETRELLLATREAAVRAAGPTDELPDTTRPIVRPTDEVDHAPARTTPVPDAAGGGKAGSTSVGAEGSGEPAHDDTRGAGAAGTHQSDERRRAALILGGLLIAVAITAGVIGLSAGDGGTTNQQEDQVARPQAPAAEAEPGRGSGDDPDTAAPATDSPTADAGESRTSGQTGTAPDEQAADDQTDGEQAAGEQAAALPDGWELHQDEEYAVGVPADWEPRDAPGTAVDLVAPSGDVYLRAADTDDPAQDVLADTQRIRDSFASRYPSYEEIALEPVEYRGHEAVRWEYTYAPDGRELRAVHLNFSTGERAYALNYQTPADSWGELSGRFDEFAATFRTR